MNHKLFPEFIPIEDDSSWWWYKAKSNLLFEIINNIDSKNRFTILEIGPGKGNNLETLSKFGTIDILETEVNFINYLKKEKSMYVIDYFQKFEQIQKKYDLVILLDVLEHIEYPILFLDSIYSILSDDGFVVIGVPAFQSLWSDHDVKMKHYKRYDWKTLKVETSKNFNIERKYGFNYLLLPIRYLQIKFSRKIHTVYETGWAINSFFYFITSLERFFRKLHFSPKFGLSIYAVLKKN